MHGLINSSIQSFVCDSYGIEIWGEIAACAGLEFADFEAMLIYDDVLTPRVLDEAANVLGRPRIEIMDDIGTYLVSHPGFESIRRLLRFGGVDFRDFLESLDDLPDRARLAVSDLELPRLELREHGEGQYVLSCDARVAGYGHVLMGVLRVMADDYGTLALLEHTGNWGGTETLSINLVDVEYSKGRSFELGVKVG